MGFSAVYFGGQSTRARFVTVMADGPSLTLYGDGVEVTAALEQVRTEPALGRARLETDAHKAVAVLERLTGQNRELRFIGLLETGYSRRFEREADEVAARYTLVRGWGRNCWPAF